MKIESKYAKKQRELAVPFKKKAKLFKNITRVAAVVTILFIIVMLGINNNAGILFGIACVMGIFTAIVFANFQTNDSKATKTEALANQIDDYIENYNLTSSEVETIDRIIEDTFNGTYTAKIDDVLVTFAPDIILSMYKTMNLDYMEICKISELTEIEVRKFYTPAYNLTEYSFDFIDNKEMGYSIDFDVANEPDGKEKVIKLIEEYYPEVKITYMPDETMDIVKRK